MSEMTLEEVAHGILNQTHTIERCGLWAAAIRAHKCDPPEGYVEVAKVREVLERHRAGVGGMCTVVDSIEAILPKKRDPLAELENWLKGYFVSSDPECRAALALVREARKERDGEA